MKQVRNFQGVVRRSGAIVLACAGVAASTLWSQECVGTEVQKLTAPSASQKDFFGSAVDISGDVAVVGANGEDANGPGSGGAHVYRSSGGTWTHEQRLDVCDASFGEAFGVSVAVDGDVIVVGAYLDDHGFVTEAGSACVFRYNGGTWVEEQKLLSQTPAVGDRYGSSVDVSGDVIVVGAPTKDVAGMGSGDAEVWRYDGVGAWNREPIIGVTVPAAGSNYGISVSVSGTALAIGAGEGSMSPVAGTGRAYLYRDMGGFWQEEQVFTGMSSVADDRFARALSLDGDTLIVGAPQASMSAAVSGTAFIFRYDGSTWNEEDEFESRNPATGDAFGDAVAVSGDLALVGAGLREPDAGSPTDAGAAYAFRYVNGSSFPWVQEQILKASDREAGDQLGFIEAVALDGSTAFVGAKFNDDACMPPDPTCDSGAAYIFDVPDVALDITPNPVNAGSVVTIQSCGGVPGQLSLTYIVDISGVPVSILVISRTYTAGGDWVHGGTIPPSAANSTLTFLTFTIDVNGGAVASNPVALVVN